MLAQKSNQLDLLVGMIDKYGQLLFPKFRSMTNELELINRKNQLRVNRISVQSEEQDLIESCLRGDQSSFRILYERYHDYVARAVVRKMPNDHGAIEEVIQDTFLSAYASLSTFQGKSKFSSWLHTISNRAVFAYFKKRYKEDSLTPVMPEQCIANSDDSGDWLDRCLAQLKPIDRMIVQLVYIDGLSMFEAAKELELSRANVLVRAHRSRKKLQKLLTDWKSK